MLGDEGGDCSYEVGEAGVCVEDIETSSMERTQINSYGITSRGP